jgi:DNA-binding CsgD family transcriptional regulator
MSELHTLDHRPVAERHPAQRLQRLPPHPSGFDAVSAELSGLVGLGLQAIERRRATATTPVIAAGTDSGERLTQVLDLLEYGVLLVGADGRVQQMNRAARGALAHGHPLQVEAGLLHVRSAADAVALRDALGQAALRGLRKLLSLTGDDGPQPVAVVPLAPTGNDPQHGVALLLARRQVCEPLTVEWFARSHRLTMAETAVIKGLCADLTPQQIAEQQGVGLATVRTQIGAIRSKTGACSIRALLRQISLLPPLVSVLQIS